MDSTEIRQALKTSLEMDFHKHRLFWEILSILAAGVIVFFQRVSKSGDSAFLAAIIGIMLAAAIAYRLTEMALLFRKAERYVFCQCLLDNPHCASRRRFRFSVDVQDSCGRKFPVKTRAIFSTRGTVQPVMEYYFNKTVTIAYNEETGKVVVIG